MIGDTFTVGEKVTLLTGAYGGKEDIYRITTVQAVSAKQLTLADGSRWTVNGMRQWGAFKDKWYSGPYIRKHRKGDEQSFQARNIRERVRRIVWERVSDATLIHFSEPIRKMLTESTGEQQ